MAASNTLGGAIFSVLFGLGMFALGFYEYADLGKMEAEGGTRHVHSLIAMVYNTAGRTGVLVTFILLGFLFLGLGVKKFVSR